MRQLGFSNWLWRYRVRIFFQDSIWVLPVLGILSAMILVRVVYVAERSWLGLKWDVEPSTALLVLGTMASSMFTFIVFLSSALLLAVQLASAQLTPRIIAFIFRDPVVKASLAAFVFSFTFTLGVIVRTKDAVPLIAGTIAGYGSLASLVVFL